MVEDPLLTSSVLNQVLGIYLIWIKDNKYFGMLNIINTAVMSVRRTSMIRLLEMSLSDV